MILIDDREFLYREYILNKKSSEELGKELNINPGLIRNRLRKFSIPIRSTVEATAIQIKSRLSIFDLHDILNQKDFLYREYRVNKKSPRKIAEENNIHESYIYRALAKHNIPIITSSDWIKYYNQFRPNNGHINFHMKRTYSYCLHYRGHWCASAAEYVYLKMNINVCDIKSQPFEFLNKRPDFLINNKLVVETKSTLYEFTPEKTKAYLEWAEKLKFELGYEFQMIAVQDIYPQEYRQALKWLRVNATRGITFTLLEEI